jgi:hypothetical protein
VGVESTTPVVIGTDCIGSCKSNYHMITTIEALPNWRANSLYTAFYKATISLQKGWLYKRSTTILNCNFNDLREITQNYLFLICMKSSKRIRRKYLS